MNRTMRIFVVLLIGLSCSTLMSWSIYRYVLRPAQAREESFAAIRSGELTAGIDGVVLLPSRWAIGSLDGKAYVTRTPERSMWVLFVKERGSGLRLGGYLFCDKPAKAGPKATIDVNYPSIGSTVNVKVLRAMNAYSYEVVNEKP